LNTFQKISSLFPLISPAKNNACFTLLFFLFLGTYTLTCSYGSVSFDSYCLAKSCAGGVISAGATNAHYSFMGHGQSTPAICDDTSKYVGSPFVQCQFGVATIQNNVGSLCTPADCQAGKSKIFIYYSTIILDQCKKGDTRIWKEYVAQ